MAGKIEIVIFVKFSSIYSVWKSSPLFARHFWRAGSSGWTLIGVLELERHACGEQLMATEYGSGCLVEVVGGKFWTVASGRQ